MLRRLRLLAPSGSAAAARAAATLAEAPPLLHGGAAYARTWEEGGFVLLELGNGEQPPLTPLADGSADPQAAARAGLLLAARDAERGSPHAEFELERQCLFAEPRQINCCTAYRAECTVLSCAAACAAVGCSTGAAEAAHREWLYQHLRGRLQAALRALRVTDDFPRGARAHTALLHNLATDEGVVRQLGCYTTAAEFSYILLHAGKVAICRAAARLAKEPQLHRQVQDFVYYVCAHATLREGDRPADAPELRTPEAVAFADAHGACASLLAVEPTAERATRTLEVGGVPVVFASPPPEKRETATKALLRYLYKLTSAPETLAVPSALEMDMVDVSAWAAGAAAPPPPVADPGAADCTAAYCAAAGFSMSPNDALAFTLGAVQLVARAVHAGALEGALHTVEAASEGPRYRVYVWHNPPTAQLISLSECTTFTAKPHFKRAVTLGAPRTETASFQTFQLKQKSWFLRLDRDAANRLKSVRVYALHARKKSRKRRQPDE